MIRIVAFLAALFLAVPAQAALTPEKVGVIELTLCPQSIATARYYMARRGIPKDNLVKVPLACTASAVKPDVVLGLIDQLKTWLADRPDHGAGIEAWALTSRWPYRSQCGTIPVHIAMGYQWDTQCSNLVQPHAGWSWTMMVNRYYATTATDPIDVSTNGGTGRIAWAVGGRTMAETIMQIDNSIAADATNPDAVALIRNGTDIRSLRGRFYVSTNAPMSYGPHVKVQLFTGQAPSNVPNVLNLFTGVDRIEQTLAAPIGYVKGSGADNLDSFCGKPDAGENCESFMRLGTSAGFGAGMEPYAYIDKFPAPQVWLNNYVLLRLTMGEAYWKSLGRPINMTLRMDGLTCAYCAVKAPEFPAPPPPLDPCLAKIPVRYKQPTTIAIGSLVTWQVTDEAAHVLVKGKTTVSSTGLLNIGATAIAVQEGPVSLSTSSGVAQRICSVVIP